MIKSPSNQGNRDDEDETFGDGSPFFKIKYIRTLREWAIYWKYYKDNNVCRLQLLEKLLSTEQLREEFSESDDIKVRVINEAMFSKNEELYEATTYLIAELIDIHKLTVEDF